MGLPLLWQRLDFGLLWLAQLVSFVGEGIFQTAMVWWVVQVTGSGTTVGLVMSVSYLPAVLLGPFAGTLADRLRPRLLLVGADLFRAALVSVFAAMAWRGVMEPWHLYVLCGLMATSGVVHSPTTLTVIPRLVPEERLDEAMALHTIVRDLSKLVGPALGGLLIGLFSVGAAFMVHALCLCVSAAAVMHIRTKLRPGAGAGEPMLAQLREGFAYVRREGTLLRLLLSFGALNLFLAPIIVLMPLSVATVFHRGSVELGVCEGVLALGSVLAGLSFVPVFGAVPTSTLLRRVPLVTAGLFLGFALVPWLEAYAALLFALGVCFAVVNVAVMTLYQRAVAPAMKGRFFALVEVLSYALFPVAMASAGALSDVLGVPLCYGLCAAGIAVVSGFLAWLPGLRTLDGR